MENEPLLVMRAMNKQTGLVVMSGAEVTVAAAVVNGELVPGSVYTSGVAGKTITAYLARLIHGNLDTILYDANKIEYCYVALDYEEELKKNPDSLRVTFNYDGMLLDVEVDQHRFQAPEIMFHPDLDGQTGAVQDLVKSAWEAAPASVQGELLENVVLAGGNTLMAGFPERLQSELSRITGRDVTIHAPSNRRFLSWIGGKLLAQTLWDPVQWLWMEPSRRRMKINEYLSRHA